MRQQLYAPNDITSRRRTQEDGGGRVQHRNASRLLARATLQHDTQAGPGGPTTYKTNLGGTGSGTRSGRTTTRANPRRTLRPGWTRCAPLAKPAEDLEVVFERHCGRRTTFILNRGARLSVGEFINCVILGHREGDYFKSPRTTTCG